MKALVLSLLAVPTLLLAQDPAPRAISLDEAVRLARRNAPAAVQARNAVRSSNASVRTNWASYLPTLSANARSGRSDGVQFDALRREFIPRSQPWSGSHSFNAGWEIFDGGRRYFNLQAAKASLDAAEATEINQSFAVALQVKQQYYAVLAARESEGAARKQLEQAEQQLRAATARVAAGAATRSDSLRSSIAVGNARLAILTAQNSLQTANAALSRLIGAETIVTAVVGDTSETETISSSDDELYALADQGPTVRQAQANVAAAKQQSRAAKTPYLPTVSLSYGQSYSTAVSDSALRLLGRSENFNKSRSINVSIPIFNGLGREETVVARKVAEDNAAATLRDSRLSQRQQMVQQLGAFRTAEARIQIQLASVQAGEEDLRVQQERYNLGASTLLDLLTSQTTLDQARQALIQARLDARTAKAQIEALIGRDL
jgi:outer membrane protein